MMSPGHGLMRERELKLSVPDRFELPAMLLNTRLLAVEELPTLHLRATYHDTDDLRLARQGVTLRHRTGEEGGARWTLKLPRDSGGGSGIADRDEMQFDASSRTVPAEVREMVTAYARSMPLRSVATLKAVRRRWLLSDDGADLAELADDSVSVLEGRRIVARFRELEIEARRPDTDLRGLAAQLVAVGAAIAEPIPKVVRALGSRATQAPEVAMPGLDSQSTGHDLVATVISDAVLRMMRNDPLARMGDEEGIHQLRVATRRLRSDLRTLGALLAPEWRADVEPRLSALADRLGAVRDLDVLSSRLNADAGELRDDLRPLWKAFRSRRSRVMALLAGSLRDSSYVELLEILVEAAQRPPVTPDAATPAAPLAAEVGAGAWRRLERRAIDLDANAPDEAFHVTRIRAKRARYAAEAAARALPDKRAAAARRFAARIADLQDLLGGLQDSSVAIAELRAAAERRAANIPFALAVGRLIERQGRGADVARAGFAAVWKDLRRRRRRRWMVV